MGYYTDYKVQVTPNIPGLEEVLDKITGYVWTKSLTAEGIKWYEHDKNMLTISNLYPDNLFILSGEGEDTGDRWKEYYKAGKSCHIQVKMTFDDFDESMLK